jgi:hypothetical protein
LEYDWEFELETEAFFSIPLVVTIAELAIKFELSFACVVIFYTLCRFPFNNNTAILGII